jgi:hypothetical protein
MSARKEYLNRLNGWSLSSFSKVKIENAQYASFRSVLWIDSVKVCLAAWAYMAAYSCLCGSLWQPIAAYIAA